MNNYIIDKIKTRGYWRINFRPTSYELKISSLLECSDIVKQSMVQFRGWNYPHYPHQPKENGKLEVGNNYYAGWIDWDFHKEYWRMYQSGQFLHYKSLREDWFDESNFDMAPYNSFKPGEVMEVLSALYQLTEIYEFLARLARNGIYNEGVDVSITLQNTLDRELRISSPGRVSLYASYTSSLNLIEFKHQYSKDILLSDPKKLALDALCYFFDRFGWHNPPMLTFQEDQNKLLEI